MHILLISSDALNPSMAGPGIRYWEFARQLSRRHTVTLLTPNESSLSHQRFQVVQCTRKSLKTALATAEVVVTQGFGFPLSPVYHARLPLVVDCYDPLPIELLEHHAHLPLAEAQLSQSYCVERTRWLLRRGDFFLYSHHRQREYWLGMLTAVGRMQHAAYRKSADLSNMFGCVPFGLPDEPPMPTGPAMRGAETAFGGAISENDTILLWGGGLWNWFDPCSLIRAMGALSRTRRDIKLVFLATSRSNRQSTNLDIAYATDQALALSRELGLYNQTVFFHDAWVPYAERQNFLVEANIGVSTHFQTLETELSFRTRILDYLWAELPILATSGDYLSELIERHQLGLTVEPENVEQLTEAMLRLADDGAFVERCKTNIRHVRQRMTWQHAVQPLLQFCRAPYRTSAVSPIMSRMHMAAFLARTANILVKYRGYRKIFAKIRRAFFA